LSSSLSSIGGIAPNDVVVVVGVEVDSLHVVLPHGQDHRDARTVRKTRFIVDAAALAREFRTTAWRSR